MLVCLSLRIYWYKNNIVIGAMIVTVAPMWGLYSLMNLYLDTLWNINNFVLVCIMGVVNGSSFVFVTIYINKNTKLRIVY